MSHHSLSLIDRSKTSPSTKPGGATLHRAYLKNDAGAADRRFTPIRCARGKPLPPARHASQQQLIVTAHTK